MGPEGRETKHSGLLSAGRFEEAVQKAARRWNKLVNRGEDDGRKVTGSRRKVTPEGTGTKG